jgi:RluA family pseudouridine synthase
MMMTFSVDIRKNDTNVSGAFVKRKRILYEDGELLVLNKRSGELVIPGRWPSRWAEEISLIEQLNKRYGKIYVVHRLDRDTSGILLFAKTKEAHQKMSQAFENRKVKKTYYGLIHGQLKKDRGTILKPLAPCRSNPGRMIVDRFGGKHSETEIQVIERWGAYSWLEIHPLTGRTHQIRLHLASIGHPLVGDPLYGLTDDSIYLSNLMANLMADLRADRKKKYRTKKGEKEKPLLSRLALHAARLEFIHPVSGESLAIEAPLAKDLKATRTQLNLLMTIRLKKL